MAPKKKVEQPIDRPLSKAYLRGFKGLSTAYPPGASEPASLRVMENVVVDRNGSVRTRPGLKYLSYSATPDMDAVIPNDPGLELDLSPVGEYELFYTANGSPAWLFAVRENDETVGFRALLSTGVTAAVYEIDDEQIGFEVPQGFAQLNFSKSTTYVRYLQLNNRVLALSDNGETARLFYVGADKTAKRLNSINVPEWADADKASVFHPDAAWINAKAAKVRYNLVPNPAFKNGVNRWNTDDATLLTHTVTTEDVGQIRSLPERTNLCPAPLGDVGTTSTSGWAVHPVWTGLLSDQDPWLRITRGEAGWFYAQASKVPIPAQSSRWFHLGIDLQAVNATPYALVSFYAVNGAEIDKPQKVMMDATAGRYESPAFKAPDGAVTVRLAVGGYTSDGGYIELKGVVLCATEEATTYFDGDAGTHYFWDGAANQSASVYHPPRDVEVQTDLLDLPSCTLLHSSITGTLLSTGSRSISSTLVTVDADGVEDPLTSTEVWTPSQTGSIAVTDNTDLADKRHVRVRVGIAGLERGETFNLSRGWCVPNEILSYFDGSTNPSGNIRYSWDNPLRPHDSASRQDTYTGALPALTAETPTADTLVRSGWSVANPQKIAVFYTFENEVGESAPSRMTEIRMQRAWSNWNWETANASGEPSGTATSEAELCADQLVVRIPQAVYDKAITDGALRWNVYAMAWSDQDPVPVSATLSATRELQSATGPAASLAYADGGWVSLTPARTLTQDEAVIPTEKNRVNYSTPPRHRNGLVADERMVLVGDPTNLAQIQWTSNRPDESTNFTPSKGGGTKTLTSGNLNVPVDVQLWQNPQSVDTITILCQDEDGRSVSYYMQPAAITQGESGLVAAMGFEQVTSTPGSAGSYAAQVVNNALYRPVDHGFLKSTANNYNLNHKILSDNIANLWQGLRSKNSIVAATLDNRIFLVVNNADGELLEQGCRGNEIWVYDLQVEAGSWSRMLIQAHSVGVVVIGGRSYLGIQRPEGTYYLDWNYRLDDYVDAEGVVAQRPIPWYLETNTQGANRAHDAWAHLQQVVLMVGDFQGQLRYGVKGFSRNGRRYDINKIFRDDTPIYDATPTWDMEDYLSVRRDMKEWVFYAGSVDGEAGTGQISAVQYRYTPVTVNVGYQFGSIETFEYGRNVDTGPDGYTQNGIPNPNIDYTRP